MDLRELERFIIVAREHTALGQSRRLPPERASAVEIVYREGGLVYRDSYFGQSRLIGQEIVRRAGVVVWGMNYLVVVRERPLEGEELAAFLQRAQLARYRERRLLGPHTFQERNLRYEDRNEGDLGLFQGEVLVHYQDEELFRMHYCGGLIR
jgi:hypothetical protein